MPEDIGAAIAAAVGSAKGDLTADPTAGVEPDKPAPTETTPEEKPAEKPASEATAKPEDKKPEEKSDEDDFWKPTAEELAAIEADAKLQKVYKSMQRGLTKKTQEIAAKTKDDEEALNFARWFKADPANAARVIAQHAGLELAEKLAEGKTPAKASNAVVDELATKWEKTLGKEGAAALRPLIEETVESITKTLMEPVTATTEELAHAATERGVAATVTEFGANLIQQGFEWDDDIQQEMADLSKKVEPATDDKGNRVPMPEYLDTLYSAVVAKRDRASKTKTALDRLKRIKAEAEPGAPVTAAPTTDPDRPSLGTPINEAVAIAVKAARRQMGQR